MCRGQIKKLEKFKSQAQMKAHQDKKQTKNKKTKVLMFF